MNFQKKLLYIFLGLIIFIKLLFPSTPSGSLHAQAVPSTTNLTGYWTFDEGSGTTAADTSGNGNNGTLTNGPTWLTGNGAKIGNGALSFDGSNDFVAVSGSPSTDISVAAWVKVNSITNDSPIVGGSGILSFFQVYSGAGKLAVYDGSDYHLSSTVLSPGNWYHVALTFVGSTKEINLYVNGVQEYHSVGLGTYTNGQINSIGSNAYYKLAGSEDEVRVYSRALASNEINDLYNYTYTGGGNSNPTPSPVNGSCGTAAKSYSFSETFPFGGYCALGTSNPSSPTNPSAGGSSAWSCVGSDGGSTASCSASRGTSSPVINPPPANGSSYVVAEGDSLTAGFGANPPSTQNYVSQLAALLPGTFFENIGFSGDQIAQNTTAADTINHLAAASGYSKRTVVFEMGLNDIAVYDSVANITHNIDLWISAVRAADPGAKIIGMTMPAIDWAAGANTTIYQQRWASVNTYIRSTAAFDYIVDIAADARFSDYTNSTYYSSDHVHPNNTGYGVFADLVRASLVANNRTGDGTTINNTPSPTSTPAAIFYVAKNGNDNNPGTQAQPWLTIQKAANTVTAGNTVIVGAGTYAEKITVSKSGTGAAPIIFDGGAGVTVGGFYITGSYVTIKNFSMNGFGVGVNEGDIQLGSNGHHATATNIDITGSPGIQSGSGGISMDYPGPTYGYFDNIRINNPNATAVTLLGSHHTVTNSRIVGTTGWDVFRPVGNDLTITNNYISAANPGSINPNHSDIFQTFINDPTITAQRVLIEGNTVVNGDGYQFGNITDDFNNGNASYWTFRNNVFANVTNTINLFAPNFSFINNTFYRVGGVSGWVIIWNNTTTRGRSDNTVVQNNIFAESGYPDRANSGWYGGDPITGLVADYNLVVGTGAGTVKTGFKSGAIEAHGLNGVDPQFVDPANNDFRLRATSPAINAGVNLSSQFSTDINGISRPQGVAWDMGAYEYYSGQPTVNAPDTVAPTVSISAPSSGATITGTVPLSATASDNTAVAGVQFKLDGQDLGTELTIAPYSGTWNTNGVANGNHILTAVARDAAGNTTTSSGVTVSVSNAVVVSPTPDVTPPAVPTGLAAVAANSTQVNLTWNASVDPTVSGAVTSGTAGYRIYRNNTLVATVTGTSYSDSGLTQLTTYSYKIAAIDGATPVNVSAQTSVVSASTPATPPPPVPPVLSAGSPTSALAAGTVRATLSLTTDKAAVCKYSATANTAYTAMTGTFTTTGGTTHSVSVANLTDGSTYTYYIRCDSTGLTTTSDYIISFSVSSPAVVTTTTTGSGGTTGGGGTTSSGSSYSSTGIFTPTVPQPTPASGVACTPMTITSILAPLPAGTTNFTIGSRGTAVTTLQTFLVSKGYLTRDSITGYYGPLTNAAVTKYKAALLPRTVECPTTATGATGTSRLVKGYQFTATLIPFATNAQVKSMQIFLNDHGYTVATTGSGSKGNETAYFGNATKAALIKFQKANNISPAIGNWGPLTRAKVNLMLK